jgi:hypothetical protein
LTHLGLDGTGIARYSQLHRKQAEQREKHCDEAMAAANEHCNVIVGSFAAWGYGA